MCILDDVFQVPPLRRFRPWLRARNLFIAATLVVLAALCYPIWWAATLKPGPLTNYGDQLTQLSADSQPDGPNGWTAIEDATDIMTEIEQQFLDRARASSETPRLNY